MLIIKQYIILKTIIKHYNTNYNINRKNDTTNIINTDNK